MIGLSTGVSRQYCALCRTTGLMLRLGNLPLSLPSRRDGCGRSYLTESSRHTTTLKSLNDELRVSAKGTYELVEVSDSQCPGTVIKGEDTYRVDHVPRPSAKLSQDVRSTYERFNGSHILPAICEGMNDHVDLDLTGM